MNGWIDRCIDDLQTETALEQVEYKSSKNF